MPVNVNLKTGTGEIGNVKVNEILTTLSLPPEGGREYGQLFSLPLVRIQLLLAQADRLGGYLYQFVVVDELQGLLQGKNARRGQLDGVI